MADEQSIGNGENTSPITRWLANLPSGMLVVYGGLMAFGTYFCMYAFRKPFQAVTYEAFGQQFNIDMKIVFVLSQLFGYLISKYIGIKVCSEIGKKWRLPLMIGLILFAEVSLVLFGLVPLKWKLIPIFMNGLPLGMVWGLCVLYIEGRKITEFLLAGMACSYIIASGVTKDVGKMVLKQLEEVDITVFWMPAVTGLLFLPLFLLFSWLLSKMPPPTPADEEERTHRQPMKGPEKTAFIKFFWFGILIQVVFYFFLTAFRDVRDGYSAEIFEGLGIADQSSIFTRSERWVAFAALATLIIIRFFNSKKWGAIPNLAFQLIGMLIVGGSTLAFQAGAVDGLTWMIMIGVGAYVAYVTCDTIFYERVISQAEWVSTAVFMTYVMDAAGYTGSVTVQLYKNFGAGEISWVTFFCRFSYFMAATGIVILTINIFYFPYRSRVRHRQMAELEKAE